MAASAETRLRIVAAGCSIGVAAALGSYPPLAADGSRPYFLFLGLAGVGLLCAGSSWGRVALVAAAVAVLAVEYVSYLHLVHNRLSILTPLYASGLVLVSELADASIHPRWTPETRRAVLQRVVRAFGVALAALVFTGALVLLAREVTVEGSWLGPIGLLAVSALLILVAALTREIAPARSAGGTGLAPTRRT